MCGGIIAHIYKGFKMNKLEKILLHTKSNGECLEWIRCLNSDGYPRMSYKKSTNGKVHRIVYELYTGEDITNKVVRHSCDNKRCINPKHLLSGTPLQNVEDRVSRNRTYKKITSEIVKRTKLLLSLKILSQKEIGIIMGIDARRVSDIHIHRYSDDGKLLKYIN